MFVDASAIIAILTDEEDGSRLAKALDEAPAARRITSVLAVWEAIVALYRINRIPISEAAARVQEFLEQARTAVLPVSVEELQFALQAFDRYGRHRLPEKERNQALNLADCFHYACAKSHTTSILHKDLGFANTDLDSAV
jgi:ribonuclease VapC